MTTHPRTADPGATPDLPAAPDATPAWLPDQETVNRWASEFWSSLPESPSNPPTAGSPLGASAPEGHPVPDLPGAPVTGPSPGGSGTPVPPGSAPSGMPFSPSHDSLMALALAPFAADPGQLGLVAPLGSPPVGGVPEGTPGEPAEFLSQPHFYFLERPTAPGQPATDQPATPSDTASFGETAGVPAHSTAGAFGRPAGFDINAVRSDFPILSERVNGKPLVWLDNAATTQKPQSVIDRLSYFYEHENSNIHRAAHTLAARATDAYEDARKKVAGFLGAGSPDEIVFVRGATEAVNLVAKTWGKTFIGEGDEIVISHLEHHANIVPWQQLIAETGAVLRVIPVDDDGQLVMSEYTRLLGPRTKLVAVTHVSNALGTVTPVHSIVEQGHRAGAKVLIDGAQSVPHLRVDMGSLNPDFYLFSGHKIFGPTGIGVLYGTAEVLESMPPWQGGGNMITDVTLEHSTFHAPPGRFEAGTGNIADAVGLGAALDYVARIGLEAIAAYEHSLLDYATPRLTDVPGLHLIGTAPDKASVMSFVLDGYATEEVGRALNEEGIAVRAGHHCAQPILRRFGVESTVRPSLAFYNTCEEIDQLVSVLHRLAADRGRSTHGWSWGGPTDGRPA